MKLSTAQANKAARKIAMNVKKEGRFNSYLAVGGPALLHSTIEEDRKGISSICLVLGLNALFGLMVRCSVLRAIVFRALVILL